MEYPVNALMDRYCFFRQKYVLMKDDIVSHIDSGYTIKQVWEHFNGSMALCVFAGPRATSFLTLDVDLRDPELVHRILDTMVELGLPREKIYVSDSGGKGYHIDIFFDQCVFNWMAKELYSLIIYFSDADKRKVEYRPTDKQAIKLPLGVHQKTGRRCWFVDRETLEPIEDFNYIETTERIDTWLIERIIKTGNRKRYDILLEEVKADDKKRTKRKSKSTKSKGNIRIDALGTRKKRMVEEALRLYRLGGDYPDIHAGLVSWMAEQDPAMYKDPWEECMRDVDSIAGWVMRKGRRQELGNDPTHEYHTRIRIYRTDALRILEGSTKAARLLAFFITVLCDHYGVCGFGEQRLCEATGIRSRMTITKAANELVEKKLFYKRQGGYKNTGNTLRPVTNKYTFMDEYVREGPYIEFDELVTAENIYQLYIHALAILCDDGELTGLTAPERKDIIEERDRAIYAAEDTVADAGGC